MAGKVLKVRNIVFGSGIPCICVPIVARFEQDIIKEAREICEFAPDCIEWRMDCFEHAGSMDKVLTVLRNLREMIGDTVLLTTFRTKNEGGKTDIRIEAYTHLYQAICESGYADMIDIEAFLKDNLLKEMCEFAHEKGVYVVGSNHDFEATPKEAEIVRRLEQIDREGADLPKIAVMPRNKRDVLNLLSATLRYRENGGVKPIITMSMSDMGVISRMTGEFFGSSLTFAAVHQTSAPGQMPLGELRETLELIHKQLIHMGDTLH